MKVKLTVAYGSAHTINEPHTGGNGPIGSPCLGDRNNKNTKHVKKDPNKQQHHTFGATAAAERLKQEIDGGAKYKSAVRILNKAQAYANTLMVVFANQEGGRYFLQLLHKDILSKIDQTGSDDIVKSLCKNVFTAKYRLLLKLSMFKRG